MTDDRLRTMLDTVYELEGLVEMAMRRRPLPQNIPALIKAKIERIAAQCRDLPAMADSADGHSSAENAPVATPSPEQEMESAMTAAMADLETPPPSDHPDTDADDHEEDFDELEIELDYSDELSDELPEEDPDGPHPDLGIFTISDKFRFRRELFSNDAEEYDTTMGLLSSMTDYSQAERYFYEDQGWDTERNPVQAEFMQRLAEAFRNAR